jgi:two-component system chemotaxis sensor kinase CheA
VLEKLGGVLTQLVRNAIDHGIEPPPERLDASKEGRGRLFLAATVAGDRLQVRIEDDGRGIDPDRIRDVALGRRLISKNDTAMHDDKAAIDLVFEPGFTMASRVTEISGRGVGLDIVRTSIRELGGEVEIRSGAGRGTAFMVSLPISCVRVSCSTRRKRSPSVSPARSGAARTPAMVAEAPKKGGRGRVSKPMSAGCKGLA